MFTDRTVLFMRNKGSRLTSFPLVDLIDGLSIRYVQNDHQNKEPTMDSFIFHVSDGTNESPTQKFTINIEIINDEKPVAVFEDLITELNKQTILTNSTLNIIDFDSKPDDISLFVEKFPKFGKLYNSNSQITERNRVFLYSDVLNKQISYKMEDKLAIKDEIVFKISDGLFTTQGKYVIKKVQNDKQLPIVEKNEGLQAIEGRVYYTHAANEPTGITSFTFNVTDSNDKTLSDQRFIISVRGDKLPPVITHNKGLRVNQGQSTLLTRFELDVKDDDTLVENIKFYIVTQPKLGRLEHQKDSGKRIDSFSYEDLAYKKIRYVHEDINNLLKNDLVDFKISDGKNDVSISVYVTVTKSDNQMPLLKSKLFLKCKELERKQISINEIQVFDRDTPNDQLKIIITHPPQYGTLEKLITSSAIDKKIEDQMISINTNLNQKLNFILKFNNNNNHNQTDLQNYVTVNEFTMSDLEKGLIFYNHRSPGVRQDRFGFIVYDGYNNMFLIDGGIQVSNYQIFNINIDLEKNQPPILEKNIGLNYLNQFDGYSGRIIMKSDLSIIDKDDSDSDLFIEITRKPIYGYIQHKERPGLAVNRFTQYDINQNKIMYILKKLEDYVQEDYFEFDVYDLGKNYLKQNRFDIKWSVVSFKEEELSVMESDGKARVHIKKIGSLKSFSMVTCKTVSDTAKSNRDSKIYDFVHTNVRIEFNEDESYKACDVIINKDNQIEPIESFYLVLEDAKYSLIGNRHKIKINILDKKKEAILEFEKIRYDVHESDRFVSLAIVRSGDLAEDVNVECVTMDETAIGGIDYVPKLNGGLVRIPPGEIYGFCDIEILDDDLKEIQTELFKVYLRNPSDGSRIGSKHETFIGILGPNDVLDDDCKVVYHTVNDNDGRVLIEITREKTNLSDSFDVLIQNIPTNDIYIKSYLNTLPESSISQAKNLTIAEPKIDYEQINQRIQFLPGDITKKIFINILKFEKLKMFTIQIKPLIDPISHLSYCDYINPDYVNIIIGDNEQNGALVGFNQTSILVNETSKIVHIPIIRSGDLSQSFSLICYTRQQTAIEGQDYLPRDSFEHSRIYFEPGDRVKTCSVEILNDQIFEAEETFQVKLSDLRSQSEIVKFNQHTTLTVTILNNEDSSVISLSEEVYYTEEPSSSDSSIFKSITILRHGDLSRTSLVRISTSDETAKAGLDYKPKTEILKFNPGVSALDFEVEILYDQERESSESFKVILGPQEPVSAIFGKIKTSTVIIKDNFNLTNQSDKFHNSPIYLNSLVYHVMDQTDDTNTVPIGEPLICLEPCDQRNPKLNANKRLCDVIDKKRLRTSYSWEISTPNEFNVYSQFIKLTQNSVFSLVNESILEPIYFQPKFRIRCVIEYSRDSSRTLKSNYVQVTEKSEFLSKLKNSNQKCNEKWSILSKQSDNVNYSSSEFNYYSKSESNLPLINFKFDKPFIARADYISAEFIKNNPNLADSDYLNYVRLSIEIPYLEGILPLISTMPLHNPRHLLNDDFEIYPNHICSNFINLNEYGLNLKYGFLKELEEENLDNLEWSNIVNKINSYRNDKTMEFYSNLDRDKCVWKFIAFYDLTELTSYCQAQIISADLSDEQSDNKNYLSIKIPLYVSYIYPNQQVTWSSVDYKTNVEAPIIYKTKDQQEIEIDENVSFFSQEKNSIDSLSVSKISMTENGKLIIEFSTVPSFHGQFMKSHTNGQESMIISPDGLDVNFNLELIWSQYTYDYPEQTWKATSTSVLNNYSGNYTISLVPCHAKPNQPFKYPFECEVKQPINYTIPISVEQSSMPVPVKYSLGTRFTLSNNLINSLNPSTNTNNFDGSFRRGDTIYGTVIWDGDQDQKSVYMLELDKIYICSSYSDFIPVYDPEGTIYNKGSQFGCAQPHKSLNHRILLLDKNSDFIESQNMSLKKNKFEAQFLHEFLNSSNSTKLNTEKLKRNRVLDGFKFNANILFEIDNLTKKIEASKDVIWYVQANFYIRAGHSKQTRQVHSNLYSLKNVFNNGTNLNIIKLSTDRKASGLLTSRIKAKFKDFKHVKHDSNYQNLVLKVIIPIVMFLIFSLFLTVTLIYYKKEQITILFGKEKKNDKEVSEAREKSNIFLKAKKKLGIGKIDSFSSSNSTNDTMIVVSPLLNKTKSEDANLTFQTMMSKSTNNYVTPSQIDEEDHYISNNQNKNLENKNQKGFKTILKNLFAKKNKKEILNTSASNGGDYEDLTKNFLEQKYSENFLPKYPTIKRNNYLYFNYNNNKLNYFNNSDGVDTDGIESSEMGVKFSNSLTTTETIVAISSISSSSPTQTTPVTSTTKCSVTNIKRLSGTEV
ncbi:unnamed protein product [Brachionus calyciflorus]|uniref:Calx-beta domain-containing protein n=1 Tax=Brachionus calyciflorus TaxID=104777 RepID=A0A813LZS8_9BILA|nr:unnamed protein product [Brachionus calyciflorus]